MDLSTLKVYGLNGIALAVGFTQVDLLLKAFLTIVVIGYTVYKWYILYQDRNKQKNEANK